MEILPSRPTLPLPSLFFFFRAHSVVFSVTATEKEVDKLRPPYLSSYSGLLFISLSLSVFTGTLLKKENMTVT